MRILESIAFALMLVSCAYIDDHLVSTIWAEARPYNFGNLRDCLDIPNDCILDTALEGVACRNTKCLSLILAMNVAT